MCGMRESSGTTLSTSTLGAVIKVSGNNTGKMANDPDPEGVNKGAGHSTRQESTISGGTCQEQLEGGMTVGKGNYR